MDLIELNANIRENTGDGASRAMRRQGKMPAVLYGPGADPVLLTIDIRELEKALKNSSAGQVLVNLNVSGERGPKTPAMIKELQTHPLTNAFLHADFYEISMDRKLKVSVPVVTKGHSRGVEYGGLLQMIRRDIEIMCLPGEIPESIEVDVTDMEIGDSLHILDIPLADGIELPGDANFTVITVISPKVEAEEAVEEEEGEEEEAEIAEAEETAEI